MAERSALITAQRESEDNLIKTIVTLASSLIALMAGFATQSTSHLEGLALNLFVIAIASFGGSIVAGLSEQFFSAWAYKEQLQMLQDFYGKYIDSFEEVSSNKLVRVAQVVSFILFVIAFVALGIFAISEVGTVRNVRHPATATSSTPAASSSATSTTSSAAANRSTGKPR